MNRLLYMIVLACIVVYASYRSVGWRTVLDRALLGSAFVLLLFFILGDDAIPTRVAEQFTAQGGDDDPDHQYVFREDLDDIRKIGDLLFYTTVFHPDSVGSAMSNKQLTSVAKEDDPSKFDMNNFSFTTDDKGINLTGEDAKMTGPSTKFIGITNTEKFTVVAVMKNYNFNTWKQSTDADVFKLPGIVDEGNANFLTVSLTNENQGSEDVYFRTKYTSSEGVSGAVQFDPAATYVYAVVVSQEPNKVVTIKRAKIGENEFHEIHTHDVSDSKDLRKQVDVELEFNPDSLLDMYLYNFAIFDKSLEERDLLDLLAHFNNNFNPIDTRCPYNDETCYSDACIGIDDWSQPMALANSEACRAKVDEYCRENYSEAVCKCWDPDNDDYNTKKCKLWRAFIGNDPGRVFDAETLSDTQVTQVKQAHSLTTIADKNAAVEEAKKNAEKEKDEAVESEKKKHKELIDVWDKAATTKKESEDDAKPATGIVDVWDEDVVEEVPKKKGKSRLINPWDEESAPGDSGKSEFKKLKRLRQLDDEEEDTKKGLFGWFRGLFS